MIRMLRLLRVSALLAAACELLSAHQDENELAGILDALRDQRRALSLAMDGRAVRA